MLQASGPLYTAFSDPGASLKPAAGWTAQSLKEVGNLVGERPVCG